MAKKKSFNQGTIWFLAILLVALIAAIMPTIIPAMYVYIILAIAGALVAIVNIKVNEERDYLLGIIGLIITVMGLSSVAAANDILIRFLYNLVVGFGVAGFIIAISMISKVSLTK